MGTDATPNGKQYKNLCHRSGRTVAVCRGLRPPVKEIKRVNLGSGITNPIYLSLPRRGNSKQNLTQDLSQKIYARTAQPARLPGENTSRLFLARICFAPCITGVVVLDLTTYTALEFGESED